MPSFKGQQKQGRDGLTDRERAFVKLRRTDLAATDAELLKQAGYPGTLKDLAHRAASIRQNPRIATHLYAPATERELADVDDETLKKEIKRRWRAVLLKPTATDADVIKAGDRLMATITGGFVPTQIDTKGTLTLESLVRMAGGAPVEMALGPHKEDA